MRMHAYSRFLIMQAICLVTLCILILVLVHCYSVTRNMRISTGTDGRSALLSSR